jgi:hypothetical protein
VAENRKKIVSVLTDKNEQKMNLHVLTIGGGLAISYKDILRSGFKNLEVMPVFRQMHDLAFSIVQLG